MIGFAFLALLELFTPELVLLLELSSPSCTAFAFMVATLAAGGFPAFELHDGFNLYFNTSVTQM